MTCALKREVKGSLGLCSPNQSHRIHLRGAPCGALRPGSAFRKWGLLLGVEGALWHSLPPASSEPSPGGLPYTTLILAA